MTDQTAYRKLDDSASAGWACGLCRRRNRESVETYLEKLDRIIKIAHMKAAKDRHAAEECYQLARQKTQEGDRDYARSQLIERDHLLKRYRTKLGQLTNLRILKHRIEEIEDLKHLSSTFGDVNERLKEALESVDIEAIREIMVELDLNAPEIVEVEEQFDNEEAQLREILSLPMPPTNKINETEMPKREKEAAF